MKFSVSILITVLLLLGALSVEAQNNEYKLDQDYGIAADGTVFLESGDAEVNIIASDRFDVNVNVYHRIDVDGIEWGSDGDFKMNVRQRDGDLYIEEAERNNNSFRIGHVDREYQITVRIPRGVSIDVKGDDGTYEITDVGGAISMVADDSDINIENATGESFSFKIDDGVIRMDKGQGKLTATLDDGELRVENGNFNEIDVRGDDAELYLATRLSDVGQYYFGIDDGDLELDISGGGGSIDIAHDDTDVSTIGAFSKVSDEEERTVYKVKGGNASVNIESEDGKVVIRYRE
ncbi:MAG: DUF4097 family beta strand repeat protein [Aliifodinibius sp.]|nr:DUF4097 domain-containing protein [candidate division KSB1 bacterium]NIT60558.1 DUF4097 domain-containing protein [Fodinibius sp.]NIV15271.1 DUF4097 family beta strand repeat protein [Fodinibius sp.]NIY29140.1 DUF4097 family beta strand repeat protein [Fodinibius sp.]